MGPAIAFDDDRLPGRFLEGETDAEQGFDVVTAPPRLLEARYGLTDSRI
jgi:hypothetical protein